MSELKPTVSCVLDEIQSNFELEGCPVERFPASLVITLEDGSRIEVQVKLLMPIWDQLTLI